MPDADDRHDASSLDARDISSLDGYDAPSAARREAAPLSRRAAASPDARDAFAAPGAAALVADLRAPGEDDDGYDPYSDYMDAWGRMDDEEPCEDPWR